MIMVHDIFICKPGNASKVAKMFKEAMATNTDMVNIMTDMTGEYNRVVMVMKFENLAAYEQSFKKYMEDTDEMKAVKEKMKGYHELYLTGSREIFQVWQRLVYILLNCNKWLQKKYASLLLLQFCALYHWFLLL